MSNKRFKREYEKEDRRAVSKKDFMDAMKPVLLAEKPEDQHSENRTPTNEEIQQRYRLDRL